MSASLPSTKSFFRRPGKFKSLHRKQKSTDSAATVDSIAPSEAQCPSQSPLDVAIKAESDHKTESDHKADAALAAPEWIESAPSSTSKTGEGDTAAIQESDDDSTPRKSEETMKIAVKFDVVFRGLPEYSGEMSSDQGLIDEEYLKAFGIKLENKAPMAGSATHGREIGIVMTPPPDRENQDTFEMEATHTTRERRPELQVSIPQRSQASKSPKPERMAPSQTPQSTVSPQMTAKPVPKPTANPLGITGSQTSIVSPLSGTDAPKHKRPPSTLSIGKAGGDQKKQSGSALAMKSANSMSSNDTSEQDGRSSGLSVRSSMSSVNSEITAGKDVKTRQPMILDATPMRVDSMRHQANLKPNVQTPSRAGPSPQVSKSDMRRQNSATSMRSTSTVNVNKPLPPEPPPGTIVSSTSPRPGISHTISSRSSPVTARPSSASASSSHDYLPLKNIGIARRGSKGSTSKVSLRSKYSTQDTGGSDRGTPKKSFPSPNALYSSRASPSQSQTSLLPDQKLHTIKEDSPRDSRATSTSKDPRQVSRGPMRMEPSREPPHPPPQAPQRFNTVSVERPDKRWFMKRSQSSNNVGTQGKSEGTSPLQRRMTARDAGSTSKANRILGKSGSTTPARRELSRFFESSRPVALSPRPLSGSTSPSSTGGQNTPESDARPDAHFEEIRKRLELLSPKDDPSVTFLAFHEKNALPPPERSEPVEEAKNPKVKSRTRSREKPKEKALESETATVEPQRNLEVAELEAVRSPSPVELEGSVATRPIEMGLPSPVKTPVSPSNSIPVPPIPVPPIPTETPQRRGRINNSNPQSTTSAKCRSLHSQRSLKARSLASLAASEIPDIYAALPTPPSLSLRPSMTAEEVEQLITADAAERVLLHILESLDNLEDLFAAALVSRGFYRTFKRNELHLLKRAIFRMSPAAWELREMSIPYSELEAGAHDYTPKLYFRHYVQDLLTMVELKGMILESCKSFLRQDTILALAGEAEERSPVVDEAFWRVWTFCRIFGCGNNREDDIVGQMDWLKGGIIAKQSTDRRTLALTDELARNSVLFNPPKGFARGNGKGLTAEELYDMTEIWTCLGVLVRVYQGKRKEAREYGVFDNARISKGDAKKETATLEEWTHHLMTLAPSTVLDVTSPSAPVAAMFAHARAQGYTDWRPPAQNSSRSTFLKEAVSRVYEEKLALGRSATSASPKALTIPPQDPAGRTSCDSPPSPGTALASRQRVAQHAAELRAKKQDPKYKDVPVSTERPMSNYKDVLCRLEALSTSAEPTPPVPKLTGLAARLSRGMPRVAISSPTRSKPSSASPSAVSVSTPASPKSYAKFDAANAAGRAASPTTRQATGGRFSSLRERVAGRANNPTDGKESRSGTPIEVTDEKVAVLPSDVPSGSGGARSKQGSNGAPPTPKTPVVVPRGPQVKDPVDLAVERLVAMGFDETRAKRALAETDSGNRINFDNALTKLIKEKEKLERLERLKKMG